MLLWKKVAGIGLVALLLSAGLALVPVGDRFGVAQAIGERVMPDPKRSGDFMPPTAGDPDGPTGDVAPPTNGSINGPAVTTPPAKWFPDWAQWKVALKFWARFTFVR